MIGGNRTFKSDARIDSYGNVDELNSHIGLLGDYITDRDVQVVLRQIQNKLFVIGSQLACDESKVSRMQLPELTEEDVTVLETEIDSMNDMLPDLTHFILPGGHVLVSCIHIARSVCRRTERSCVSLKENEIYVAPLVLQYLNRLSDYLFVLARYTGKQLDIKEVIWKG